jgi:hypothetical protein
VRIRTFTLAALIAAGLPLAACATEQEAAPLATASAIVASVTSPQQDSATLGPALGQRDLADGATMYDCGHGEAIAINFMTGTWRWMHPTGPGPDKSMGYGAGSQAASDNLAFRDAVDMCDNPAASALYDK